MSRQYDDFIDSHFEYNGETYALIEPGSPEELADAFKNCDLLQDGIARGVVEFQGYLAQQEEYIRSYMSDLGDYDNTLLVKNISFQLKKTGLRIGDLENAIGLSTGYISRTSKPGAGRKMSIDSVWKIARLFNTELQDLVEKDLEAPTYNTALVLRFITKLITQTVDEDIRWTECGDAYQVFENFMLESGIFIGLENYKTRYRPVDHLNPAAIFTVADLPFICGDVRPGWYLVILPYVSMPVDDKTNYDFIFFRIKEENDSGRVSCEIEKGFYSTDDPARDVSSLADKLYKLITNKSIDTTLDKNIKSWMIDYLS